MATNGYIVHDGNYIAYGKKVIPNDPFNGGGGGGDSNFSTAKLTIINNSGASLNCTLIVAKYFDWNDTYASYAIGFIDDDSTPVEYDLILYKGNSQVYIETDPENLTLSGSIISDEDGGYYAQGDCSITISA